MKKIYLIFSLLLIFLLTACGQQEIQQVAEPVKKVETKYTIVENEEKFNFNISSVTTRLNSEEWNYNIFNDFIVLLDTEEDISQFPYLYNNITVYKTAPKVYIIPRFYQLQYSITDVSLKNGVITIKYTTENNPLIDRVIGQTTNIEYTFYGIDLSELPDGKFNFNLIRENAEESTFSKDFEITIPKPILTWQIKNISKGKGTDIIYSSNKTGDWQIFKFDTINKVETQLTDRHSDIDIDNLNMLGYTDHNSNIPSPIYNEEKDYIFYALGSDIYEVAYDGTRSLLMSLDMEDGRSPNGYKTFEKAPLPTQSGFKILYQEVFEPAYGELFIAPLSDLNKKTPVVLPEDGNISYFTWGRNENENIVCLYNRKNSQMNGYYNLWVFNNKDSSKKRKIDTYGYKINSIDVSSNKDFIIFAQTLHSSDSDMLNDLFYVNTNNTELKRITPKDERKDINPSISPNNEYVAYMSSTDDINYNLYIMNIDGTNRKQIGDLYITEKPYWLNNYELIVIDAFANILKINALTGDYENLVEGYDKLNIEEIMSELNGFKIYSMEE